MTLPQQRNFIVISVVLFRLDFCNSLLTGLSLYMIKHVQNCLARLILRAPRFEHISTRPKQLHWLPIPAHFLYKHRCLAFSAISFDTQSYFSDLLTSVVVSTVTNVVVSTVTSVVVSTMTSVVVSTVTSVVVSTVTSVVVSTVTSVVVGPVTNVVASTVTSVVVGPVTVS